MTPPPLTVCCVLQCGRDCPGCTEARSARALPWLKSAALPLQWGIPGFVLPTISDFLSILKIYKRPYSLLVSLWHCPLRKPHDLEHPPLWAVACALAHLSLGDSFSRLSWVGWTHLSWSTTHLFCLFCILRLLRNGWGVQVLELQRNITIQFSAGNFL